MPTPEPATLSEMLAELAQALDVPSIGVTALEPSEPFPWAVFDPETCEILGAGYTTESAAAEALGTVRGWR